MTTPPYRIITRFHGDAFGTYEAHAFLGGRIVESVGTNLNDKADWFFTRSQAKSALVKRMKSKTP